MVFDEIFIATLLLVGSLFGFSAALGLLRMPDFYTRMSTSGKAATLCCGLLLGGVAAMFHDTQVTARAVAALLFLLFTVPIGVHMIARAAYRVGTPMWRGRTASPRFKNPKRDLK
ncbi:MULTISPECIES: monovalent cation/H(+) antiporter subunit G [Microbulbifer]|uniref:monovalent cation/H(+) antiporter subunit G n=1 Tax=Microbulbifer TaxID=48073 RepID=UPI0012679599|nr:MULTISPECIES: monovalent cation/H(+) antiporter subunit G [Microbulbifer]QFT56334.1 Na(+)/H(+) antiporter subunit G1 [Microbulbifer sp. THAF38]